MNIEQQIIEEIKNMDVEVYVDYRDFEELEYLLEDHETKEEFCDKIEECYRESIWEYEDEAINELTSKYGKEYEEIIRDNVYEYLNVKVPIDKFLNCKIKCNILCDFYDDGNTDFTSHGWLKWLMNSQGYKMNEYPAIKILSDYYDYSYSNTPDEKEIEEIRNSNSKFLKSLLTESINMFKGYMRTFTIMAEISIEDYYAIKNKSIKEFIVKTNAMCGLFNCWSGSGSSFDIELEKEIKIKTKNIYLIQTEGIKNHGTYTVNDVYGFIGSCWKDCIRI